jgi:PEP-CTERM motif
LGALSTCSSVFDPRIILTAFLAVFVGASVALAAPINYGDFTGTNVKFLQVTEDALTPGDVPPLFGAPIVSGDSMDFNPVGFNATHANGVGPADITDGQLKFEVEAKNKTTGAINNIKFQEAGDTTLAGIGNNGTFTSVTSDVFFNITEINGGAPAIPIPGFSLAQVFSPQGGFYGLGNNGGGPFFHTQWMGMLLLDLNLVLANNGYAPGNRVTKLSVNLDNTLVALSQPGTSALIAKKDTGVIITVNIPEPATCCLALFGLVGLLIARRRS